MNRMISREKVSGKTESIINGVLEINSRSMGEELETNYNTLGQDWHGTRKRPSLDPAISPIKFAANNIFQFCLK